MGGRGGSSGLSLKADSVKLTKLKGSDKQIEWATDIRDRMLREVELINIDSNKFHSFRLEDLSDDLVKKGYSEYKFRDSMTDKEVVSVARKIYKDVKNALRTEERGWMFINNRDSYGFGWLFKRKRHQ